MKRILVIFITLGAVLLGVRLFGACLDVTPIVVEHDAYDPDASCLKCLEQPEGCLDIIAGCQADPRCKPAFACVVRETCFDLLTLDDKIKCGLPCAQEAGIEAISDPVISTYFVGLIGCAQVKCEEPCHLQDASLGL